MNRNSPISRIFGESPIEPLQRHFNKVAKCARKLPKFIKATFDGDWAKAERMREKIVLLEHAADERKRQLRLNLPGSLFIPVNRGDVLEIVSRQDRIANRVKDISGMIMSRRLLFPEALRSDYLEFLARNLDAVHLARKAVRELDDLLHAGFGGAEVSRVMQMTDLLSDLEDDSDARQSALRANLYRLESELSPIDAMFLYKVIDRTGDLGNIAQRVGSRLHLMIAR